MMKWRFGGSSSQNYEHRHSYKREKGEVRSLIASRGFEVISLIEAKIKNIFPFCLFLFTFIVYLRYLAPTVLSGDVAEFAIASHVLGIPHPSGYPLYIWTGKIFTLLPLGDIGFRINLMSAFFAALTVSITYLIIKIVTNSEIASVISALTLAFSYIFWSHALFAEVYTFNAFIVSIAILLLFRWFKIRETRILYLLSIILGLSVVSHLSSIFIIPAFFFSILMTDKIFIKNKKKLIIVLLFFLALSLYAWIPIRASQQPLWNWGNPDTIQKAVLFIIGTDIQWGFSPTGSDLVYTFLTGFYDSFFIFGVILGILGLYLSLRGSKKIFLFLISAFCSYFIVFILFLPSLKLILPVLLIWVISIGLGISEIINLLKTRVNLLNKANVGVIFLILLLLLPIPMILANEQAMNDIHNNYSVADYGKNALKIVPMNSLIITDWDVTVFKYFQILYNVRKDVTVVGDCNYSNWINVVDSNIAKHPTYLTNYYSQEKITEKYNLIPVMVVSAPKITTPWRISTHDWDDVLYKVEIKSQNPIVKNPEIPHNLNANFSNTIIFLGYNLSTNEVNPGDAIQVTYYWKLIKEIDVNYTTDTYLMKKQKDGECDEFRIGVYPTHIYYPTSLWKEGDIVKEDYSLVIPTNADYGEYEIRINKYDWTFGTLKVLNLNTSDDKDRLLIGHLYVNQK